MRLGDFSDEGESVDAKTTELSPDKKEIDDALLALHRAYLVVDTLVRNLPENLRQS